MKNTKNLKKRRKNKTFKGGANQSENQLQINNKRIQDENSSLRTQLEETKRTLQNLKQKMRLRDNEQIKDLTTKNQQRNSQINQLTGLNQRAESKIIQLGLENNDLLSNIKKLEEQLKSKFNELGSENRGLISNIKKLEEELKSKIVELGSENQQLISTIKDLEAKIKYDARTEESTDQYIDMLTNENEQLKLSLNQRDKKIYHLWKVLCKYIIYTGGLQDKIREDTNNYQARLNEINQFSEWFNQNVSGKIPRCDETVSLETWLSGEDIDYKTENINY